MRTETVRIGRGRAVHAMADGSGPVPAGRARCELDGEGRYAPHRYKDDDGNFRDPERISEATPLGVGTVTCKWCLTRRDL
jgi:hypothetical protein